MNFILLYILNKFYIFNYILVFYYLYFFKYLFLFYAPKKLFQSKIGIYKIPIKFQVLQNLIQFIKFQKIPIFSNLIIIFLI